jgi:hypothetical protein
MLIELCFANFSVFQLHRKKMVFEGFPLLYLQPSTFLTSLDNEKEDDWTGESVTMTIKPGMLSTSMQLPRLEWSTWGGGWSHPEVRTTSLDLLQIHSVLDHEAVMGESTTPVLDPTLVGEETESPREPDVYAFIITTEQGDVHIFEASSENERDQVVCGLKNVMARLSYQLIAGDDNVSTELFQTPKSEEPNDNSSVDLPPIITPTQAVQNMTHNFLDW